MTTFHDNDLSIALRRMAKRSRDEAQVLLDEADRLERAAAIVDKQKYETVPLAAVRDALEMGAPVFADEVLTPVGAGPKNGPGATYRLATTGKKAMPNASTGRPVSGRHATAPAEIPPAAPTPVARDHVDAAALTRGGEPRKFQPRTVAEIVSGYEPHGAPAIDAHKPDVSQAATIPGQIVLDMLREAGAAGEKPSRLRVGCGLEPTIFRMLMQTLMESGAVVRERDADGPVESVRYRLKEHAQRVLANAAPQALDGRGHEEGAP